MNNSTKFEDRASSSPSTHEGEPSESLCDRLSRTRDTSQRQLPTDQDYAVSTREYQTDQSSLKHASTAACPALEKQQKQPQRQKQPHRFAGMDRVTPYQRFITRPVRNAPRLRASLCGFVPHPAVASQRTRFEGTIRSPDALRSLKKTSGGFYCAIVRSWMIDHDTPNRSRSWLKRVAKKFSSSGI